MCHGAVTSRGTWAKVTMTITMTMVTEPPLLVQGATCQGLPMQYSCFAPLRYRDPYEACCIELRISSTHRWRSSSARAPRVEQCANVLNPPEIAKHGRTLVVDEGQTTSFV